MSSPQAPMLGHPKVTVRINGQDESSGAKRGVTALTTLSGVPSSDKIAEGWGNCSILHKNILDHESNVQ